MMTLADIHYICWRSLTFEEYYSNVNIIDIGSIVT